MNVNQIIDDLRAELNQLNEAILALERVASGQVQQRGRPPAWLTAMTTTDVAVAPKRRGRPPGSKDKPK